MTLPLPQYDLGDVNLDGKINAKDASLALVAYAENETNPDRLTAVQKAAADVDFDGKITAKDASKILRFVAFVQDHPDIDMRTWIGSETVPPTDVRRLPAIFRTALKNKSNRG